MHAWDCIDVENAQPSAAAYGASTCYRCCHCPCSTTLNSTQVMHAWDCRELPQIAGVDNAQLPAAACCASPRCRCCRCPCNTTTFKYSTRSTACTVNLLHLRLQHSAFQYMSCIVVVHGVINNGRYVHDIHDTVVGRLHETTVMPFLEL